MYGVLERVMTAALPMLSAVVDRARKWDAREDKDLQPWNRIQCLTNSRECTVPEICGDGECWSYNMPDELIDEDEDEDVTQRRWFEETHPIEQPDPCSDDEDDDDYEGKRDDEGGFAFPHPHDYKPDMFPDGSRLQFLVKLANIELTPEKPTYDGGSWHIEGQLNEAIVATAIYYYDSNNITHSHLAFRTPADAEEMVMAFSYVQSDHLPLKILYDLDLPSTDTQGKT
jgi:hypothetical protein